MPSTPRQHRPPGWKPSEQRRIEYDQSRGSSSARGYDAAWKRTRRLFLAKFPMCSEPGCRQLATDVDHVESIKDRPDLRLSWSNLRSFCHGHHSARTARDQGFAQTGRGMGV